MKRPLGAGLATLLSAAAAAQDADPFAALAVESRPLPTRLETDFSGQGQLGAAYTSADNWMFGQYNGLSEKGAVVVANLAWRDFDNVDSQWQVNLENLGLDTRSGWLRWGRSDGLNVQLELDSQLQVRNRSGRTPFVGNNNLQLPADWVTAGNTDGFTALDTSLAGFGRELARDRIGLRFVTPFADDWEVRLAAQYEDKQGTSDVGASIYVDAEGGQAALLPVPIDQRTAEFEVALAYSGTALHLDGQLFYSDYDNRESVLRWQNPYTAGLDTAVDYPAGLGGWSQAPDNTSTGGRLQGQYLFSASTRLQIDASYTVNEQDDDFLDYSVNPALTVVEPLPRDSLGGQVDDGLFRAVLITRPTRKLQLEGRLEIRERDYQAPRDGYRYIPGDGGNQSRPELTVYNSRYDINTETFGVEGSYRLPLRSRLYLGYDYEEIERENIAVRRTEEDRFHARYRIAPVSWFNGNVELAYGDRAASTYEWDQSYYARLDSRLINATPDNQRYLNHPAFSQYYLSNRERSEAKLDLGFTPRVDWSIQLNLLWRDDDYDKTQLGLRGSDMQRYNLTTSYTPGADLSLSAWASFDRLDYEQAGRAFRGGIEKNAFDIYPPLPQASDPGRDWQLDSRDDTVTLGARAAWQPDRPWGVELDYQFVDTRTRQGYDATAPDLDAGALPDIDTRLHHLKAAGQWHLRDALTLQLDYQYYRYATNDWARNGIAADSLDRVLTFGERNPNETVHYVGLSAWYRWQ